MLMIIMNIKLLDYINNHKLQFIIEIICKLIILFPLKGMGVPIVEFVREYKFSAG